MTFANFGACEHLAAAHKVLMDYRELPAVTTVDLSQGHGGTEVTFLFFYGTESERIAAVDLLGERLGLTEIGSVQMDDGTWMHQRRSPWRTDGRNWCAKAFNLTVQSTEAETPDNTLAGAVV